MCRSLVALDYFFLEQSGFGCLFSFGNAPKVFFGCERGNKLVSHKKNVLRLAQIEVRCSLEVCRAGSSIESSRHLVLVKNQGYDSRIGRAFRLDGT